MKIVIIMKYLLNMTSVPIKAEIIILVNLKKP